MFHSARLQLTAWYLLLIMGISILFSTAFYKTATMEVQRIIDRMEHERQDPFDAYQIPAPVVGQRIAELQSSKQELLYSLIFLNGIIFLVSAGGGYFLAGRTLKPIQKMVEEQNRFITDASHELRTPLTATRTGIEVALRDKDLTLPDARKTLEGSLEDITSIQSLSDNLLRLSQFESMQTSSVFQKVLVPTVLDAAVKKVSTLAKAKQITIVQKTNKSYVKGDLYSLEELFIIFLDNAIKYSPKGSTIVASSKRTDGHVMVSFEDKGVGIAKEDITSIFDRFYRAEKSRTKNKAEGYGLGLSIAKKIIEEHKGSVKVESTVGKGTLFTISLPATS